MSTVQATLDALGGSLDSAAEASPLIWAQLAAAAHTGCSSKSIPLATVYSLDWDEAAINLPGMFSAPQSDVTGHVSCFSLVHSLSCLYEVIGPTLTADTFEACITV